MGSNREIGNLEELKDFNHKYVITTNKNDTQIVDGIQVIHIVDFLLMENWWYKFKHGDWGYELYQQGRPWTLKYSTGVMITIDLYSYTIITAHTEGESCQLFVERNPFSNIILSSQIHFIGFYLRYCIVRRSIPWFNYLDFRCSLNHCDWSPNNLMMDTLTKRVLTEDKVDSRDVLFEVE